MPETTIQETAAGGYLVPDAHGTSYYPNSPQVGSDVGRTSGAKDTKRRSVVAFSLGDGGIVRPVRVIDSKLSLWVLSYTASPGVTCYVYRVVRNDWVEAELCWNYYKGTTVWSTAMCDHSTNDMVTTNGQSFTSPTVIDTWLDITGSNLNAQIQYAINNNVSPNRTVHMLIRVDAQGTTEAQDTRWVAANSEDATESYHPKLWVKYRRGVMTSDVRGLFQLLRMSPLLVPAALLSFIINRRMVLEMTQKSVRFHGSEQEYNKWRFGL